MNKIFDYVHGLWDKQYSRVRCPTVFQMEATECGAICLMIILAYHGKHISSSEAREACDVSRDGSKAINIVKAARKYNMNAHGFAVDLDDLATISLPAIIFWEFNHFVVLEGYSTNKVYLNDPATGPRNISYAEFSKAFTGVAIEFTPAENFVTDGVALPSTFKILLDWIVKARHLLIYMMLLSVLCGVISIVPAITEKIFIDNVLIAKQWQWANYIIILLFIVASLSGFLAWMQQRYLLLYVLKTKANGVAAFVWIILHMPLIYFQQRSPSDVAERLESYDVITNFIAEDFAMSIAIIITMIFYAVAMWLISSRIACLVLLLAILNITLIAIFQKKMADYGQRMSNAQGLLMAMEMSTIDSMETLKANALDTYFFNRWANQQAKEITATQKITVLAAMLELSPVWFALINTLLIIGYGSYLVINRTLTIGSLVGLQALSASFYQPLTKIFESASKFTKLKGHLYRILDVTDYPVKKFKVTTPPLVNADNAILIVDKVQFGYSQMEPPILWDFSLTIQRGEKIGIIGESGCGKSTLLKMICGFYMPWQGNIYVAGKSIYQLNPAERARDIAYVGQNIYLFSGTIKDNLTLWNDNIDLDLINEILAELDMLQTITERGGLEEWVTDGGKNFSGGERQRFEIARALLMKPKLLILDEATSALDNITEGLVYTTVNKYADSVLIVAHRLSAITHCNKIYVLKDGEIIESGNHNSLMAHAGYYCELTRKETL